MIKTYLSAAAALILASSLAPVAMVRVSAALETVLDAPLAQVGKRLN